jgi:hypothetical protein
MSRSSELNTTPEVFTPGVVEPCAIFGGAGSFLSLFYLLTFYLLS